MGLSDKAFEDRANYIGGSEVATVLGLNPWSTPAALMAAKLSGIKPKVSDQKQRIMEVGKALEESVLEFFRQANPHRHFEVVAREPEYFIKDKNDQQVVIVSHPDVMRFEVDPTGQRGSIRLLEIKTTTGWRDDISAREVPAEYRVQVQMEMHGARQAGADVDMVDLAIYNLSNGNLHCHQAVYDREFCEKAVETCTSFLDLLNRTDIGHDELVKMVAGPADNIQDLLQVVAGMDVLTVGEDAEEVRQVYEMIDRLHSAKEGSDLWNKEFVGAKNTLANHIGDKRAMELFGDKIVSYGNVRPAARNASTIREMEQRFCAPNSVAAIAKAAIARLASAGIPGMDEGLLVDAIEPAVALVAGEIANDAIKKHMGQPTRMFRPNYKKIEQALAVRDAVGNTIER